MIGRRKKHGPRIPRMKGELPKLSGGTHGAIIGRNGPMIPGMQDGPMMPRMKDELPSPSPIRSATKAS